MYIVILVILLIFIPWNFVFELGNQNGKFVLRIFLRLLFFKIKLVNKELAFKSPFNAQKRTQNLPYFLLLAVKIKKLELKTRIGTGDAAETALLVGGFKIIVESLLAVLSTKFASFPSPPFCNFTADFNQKVLTVEFLCITCVSLGNIMYIYGKRQLRRFVAGVEAYKLKKVKESGI